jgi:hypothetical protein
MQLRGVEQLYDRFGFGLCAVALHRLLARQLSHHERPWPIQWELLSKLDLAKIDGNVPVKHS